MTIFRSFQVFYLTKSSLEKGYPDLPKLYQSSAILAQDFARERQLNILALNIFSCSVFLLISIVVFVLRPDCMGTICPW